MDDWDDDNDNDEEVVRDFKFGGKDATVFLVDASPQMHIMKKDDVDDLTPFTKALKAICGSMKKTVFASPNDLVSVLLYGTEKQVGIRDFEHLSLVVPMESPCAESILKMEKLCEIEDTARKEFQSKYGSSRDFSLDEALWQCQSLFSDIPGTVGKKRVLLMTCDDNPHRDSKAKRDKCWKKSGDLRDTGIVLEVLPLVGNEEEFDMGTFFKDVQHHQDDQQEEISSLERLQDLERVIRKRVHKKRSVGKTYLNLGHGVKISVANYNFIQKTWKPSKVKLAKDTNDEVKVQRNFINYDTGAPLLPSDINKFQEYGGKRLKFTLDETKSMAMLDGELGLKLCGFKPINTLKWGHFVRSGNFLYPDETLLKGSRQLFAALHIKCLEKNVYAMCSFKARDNSGPSFVALVPQEEKSDEYGQKVQPAGFQLIYLPFADDIRNVPDVKFVEPDPEQIEVAKKLVKAIQIKTFDPNNFKNPDLQAHYNLVESLALQRDEVIPSKEDAIEALENMEDWIQKKKPDIPQKFLDSVYPPGYDPDNAPAKRKAPPTTSAGSRKEPAVKKSKNEEAVDVAAHITKRTVDKLTVAQLKEYFQSQGIKPLGKKKAELVQEIYDLANS